jgi:hypothetical protein
VTRGHSAPALTKGILKLSRHLDATATPDYVAVEPGEDCLPDSCFDNVATIVRRNGGSIQHGWRLRQEASAYVEGRFHAVWRRHDGTLIDVTPRTDGVDEILFLPDSRLVWTGEPVEPRRVMLNEQPCYCGSGIPFKICHGLSDD